MDSAGQATLHSEATGAASARHLDLAAKTFQQFRGAVTRADSGESASVTAHFPGPALAARAAVEFQRRLVMYNLQLPEEQRVGFRTAIHDDLASAVELAHEGNSGRVLVSRAVSDSVVLEKGITCSWLREEIFELMGAAGAPAESGGETMDADTPPPTQTVPVSALAAALPPRYEILSVVGRGGMGVVYKARDRETGEVVALKVLQSGLSADPGVLERFKNELRLARRITHKNVCRIHEFNRSGDLAYISMEFVDGESLRDMLRRRGKLDPEQSVGLAQQVCAGLQEAHAQGVVHRDLKPENIMVDRSGVVKLMDFGIARSLDGATSHTHGIIGTPAYMAPEQAEGRPVDRRTDIYSLGLILFEMFTGTQAFQGQTLVEVVLKQIRERPPMPSSLEPSLPANLEEAVLRCLKKDPERRFQSVDELSAVLAEKMEFVARPVVPPVPAFEPPAPEPPPRPVARKNRVWIIVILIGSFFVLRQYNKSRQAESDSRRESVPAKVEEATPPVEAPAEKAPETDVEGPKAPKKERSVYETLRELEKLRRNQPNTMNKGLGSIGRFIPPEEIKKVLQEADKQLEAGNYDEARNIYITVLTVDPTNVRAKGGLDKVGLAMRDSIAKKVPQPPKAPPKP